MSAVGGEGDPLSKQTNFPINQNFKKRKKASEPLKRGSLLDFSLNKKGHLRKQSVTGGGGLLICFA